MSQTALNFKTFGMDYEYSNKIKKGQDVKQRKITSTKQDLELQRNSIQTSKYTTLNFIPKNLFEQFSKMANMYFLIFGLVQMENTITISNGVPTIYFPLVTIVTLTAMKDYYEDYKRKKSDREENQSRCIVLREGVFIESQWQNLRVGDVVKVLQNQFFPADILLLNSTEPKGVCYIETKGLDGETNLKQRKVQQEIYHYFQDNKPQEEFNDEIFNKRKMIFGYEQPNPLLEKFDGYVELPDHKEKISIGNNNICLRGCSLRNTKFIYGLVCNSGHETKIQKNSFKARAKRSRLETTMNNQILLIFVIQVIICVFCGLYYYSYIDSYKDDQPYMEYDNQEGFVVFIQKFGTWFLIFGNFVPISLLVTLEFVKLFQAVYIYYDDGTYDRDEDGKPIKKRNHNGMIFKYENEKGEKELLRTQVQSSNLNEELGQVEYIFSDKTGTLTCNIMQFKKISINGISYGEVQNPEDPKYIQDISTFPEVTNVNFRDSQLIDIVHNPKHPEHEKVMNTLIFLSITHTIIISEEEDPDDSGVVIRQYNASSPDELALVNFAKFCGVEYFGTDEDENIVLKIDGVGEKTIKLLHIFEFDSTRKRQSVVIQDEKGQIKLLCKGADSVILKLSDINKCEKIPEVTSHLEEYSLIGLRTLLLSERIIDQSVYQEWSQRYNKACTALVKREEKMQECQKELEVDLIVVGATAIEDQLQDEVGETIAALKQAGIKVWVLTGDKVETARNIGYSCKLLNQSITQYKVQLSRELALDDEKGKESVIEQLKKVYNEIVQSNEQQMQKNDEVYTNNALIITGDALIHGLEKEVAEIIVNITMYCEAVLCCRVSPKQKQQIVSLVRNWNKSASTLAIGDGANDVNMITAAHVGIGIKGLEGQQASRASDYAIGEFKLLRRLLFFHGREAYRRNSRLVCYNFYKNIILVTVQFWFAFQNFFAGQTLYDSYLYQIYNVFYTSVPIIVYAVMDLEFNPYILTQNKINYYLPGIQNTLFNKKVFWQWFFIGFIQAFLVQLVSFEGTAQNFVNSDGQMFNFWCNGTMAYGMVVLIVNLKIFIISFDHTICSVFFNLGSLVLYLLSLMILNNMSLSPIQNQFGIMMGAPIFHLGNCLGIVATSLAIDFAMERWIRGSANSERNQQYQKNIKTSQILPTENDRPENQGSLQPSTPQEQKPQPQQQQV